MASMIDFRNLYEGLGGEVRKKRAREESAVQETALDEIRAAKRSAVAMEEDGPPVPRPVYGAPTYDGVIAGKVSGRKWKAVKTTRASSMKANNTKPVGFEEKFRQREVKKAYNIRVAELKEEIRSSKQQQRKAKEERKKTKEANELRTGTKLQKISNPGKLKKMSKKQRKLLKVVD